MVFEESVVFDMQQTLTTKVDKDMDGYVTLGACDLLLPLAVCVTFRERICSRNVTQTGGWGASQPRSVARRSA